MACGQKCKEVLDMGAAAQRSFECMRNSIIALNVAPNDDAAAQFKTAAEAYSRACADLAATAVVTP